MGIFNTKNAKDAKSAKEFEEFKKLTEELEVETARPYAPDAPAPFKQELREQLLQTHEKRGLSWGEMGRLWRFASTAVALLLLVVAVGLFWAAISGRGTAVGPAQDTIVVATRTAVPEMTPTPVPMSQTFTESDVVSWSNSPAHVIFGHGIQLERYDIDEQETGLRLALHWQTPTGWPEPVQLFVHLQNEAEQVVWQHDSLLNQSGHDTLMLEPLMGEENGLPNGRYDIIIGLYDPTTGQRLPVTAENERMVVDGGTAVWLTDWEFEGKQDRIWLISASPEPGTNLFDTNGVPTTFSFEIGYDLVSAESARFLWEMIPIGAGNLPRNVYYSEPWQEVQKGSGVVTLEITMSSVRPDQLASAIMPHIWLSLPGKQITLSPETLAKTQWPLAPDTNVLSLVQKARPSANALVEIEVTVNYEPVTDKELFLKLHYAAPNWESFTGGGRMPIDGLSDYVPLNPEENSVTITFTGNPAEMAQIVGTSQPALVVQLVYFEEGVNGRELKILAHHTYSGALDLSNPDEVRYEVVP